MKKEDFKRFLKLKYLGVLVIVVFMGAGVAWGLQTGEWFRSNSGTTIDLDLSSIGHGSCVTVDNRTGSIGMPVATDYFVPAKIGKEFASFALNIPSGVTSFACCTDGYRDYDKDGYGAGAYGCYGTDASYNIVADNTDCYDSSSTVFPGNTGTNATCSYAGQCSGFYQDNVHLGDHNCSGGSDTALWRVGVTLPTAFGDLVNLKTVYWYDGGYQALSIGTGGTCGTGYVTPPNGSWYVYAGGTYQEAMFGGINIFCR